MATVIPRIDEVEVYANGEGDVVIKQTTLMGDESFVFIPPNYVAAVCKALREAVKEARDA